MTVSSPLKKSMKAVSFIPVLIVIYIIYVCLNPYLKINNKLNLTSLLSIHLSSILTYYSVKSKVLSRTHTYAYTGVNLNQGNRR